MSENSNKLLFQIVDCGNLIQKKQEHFKKINIDDKVLLGGLSQEEQESMSTLLTKMKDYWIQKHKENHSNKK